MRQKLTIAFVLAIALRSAFLMSAPADAAPAVLGDANVETAPDSSGVGMAEANRFVATASASVDSLLIYVDATSRATTLALGLYADAGGAPGALIAQGSRTGVQNGAWNTVTIPATALVSGTPYWIARLAVAGGDLVTRVDASTPNADRTDTRASASLPSTFSAGGSWPHLTSMYAAAGGAPTPTPTATPTPTPSPTATPAPQGFVGDNVIEGVADGSGVGTAEANRFVASQAGAVSSLSIFLDASNRATTIALGLYTDAGGAPGALITQGSRSAVLNGAWNAITVPAMTLTSGTPYWIARLATAGGNLVTRVDPSGTNADRIDTRSSASLPSTFSPGASYPHRTSMYAAGGAVAQGTPTPTPAPTPTPTASPGSFTCTEVLGFSQTGNWWSLQRSPNDAFESMVDGARYQVRAANGGAVWKWFNPSIDPTFDGWSMSPTSPCAAGPSAPDRVIMDITESFWIGDACGAHAWDDCRAGSDTSVGRVTQDVVNVVSYIRAHYPSVRQIYLKPLVGGPPGGGQCYIVGQPIRAIQNSPLIAQAIAAAIPMIPAGVQVLQAPTWGVRDCGDFYDDGQYVGHLNPANDAKPRIGQMIGAWFATRP